MVVEIAGHIVMNGEYQTQEMAHRPPSATHGAVGAVGLGSFLLALAALRISHPFGGNMVWSALFVMVVTAGGIFLVDLGWRQVHRRSSTGMDFGHDDPSWSRSLVKYVGVGGSLGFVALLYWLFPEYHASFYTRYYDLLKVILPVALLLGLPYIYIVDRHMPKPRDGTWQMGMLVLMQWREVDHQILGQHMLGWLIKGFFLPLMFIAMCDGLGKLLASDIGNMTTFKELFDFLYEFLYFIDVGLVSMGYLMTFRLTDTHVRSAEPSMLGWAAALVCYEPFWSLFGRQYLAYDSGYTWGQWLWNNPVAYCIWGTAILALVGIYVWATVVFGARFSNLTHRGIITNGPYRWTKHPAYIAKNLSWWLISIPFLTQGPPTDALRQCLLLLGLNGLYVLRAKTEEWHLWRDPDYVHYAQWIKQYGLFRFLRHMPTPEFSQSFRSL